MAFISLKDIGKIYVSDNSVAVGIRGINLDFNMGEFVAITGKSGAGKSTLLNVLSGIDSYEEGEMYVNGNPTSHYIQSDWEEYRKEYISFIFQDYNIIESFTVLENVELALINIKDHKERRKRALELIDRVGLTSHIKSKGSKLSGGQKQRTVIARALAKDSPIILADEPTGNLDSKSSKEIIELLSEVSKDKLLIVVTHNFDDFASYATRHIRIFDGGVENDEVIKDCNTFDYVEEEKENQKLEKKEKIREGLNLGYSIFKSKPRLTIFMCLLMLVGTLAVFFITAGLSSNFSIYKKQTMFTEHDGRVVITKNDGTYITDDELNSLKNKYNLVDTVHYDYLLDSNSFVTYMLTYNGYYYNANLTYDLDLGNNIIGKYPEAIDECLLYLPIGIKQDIGNIDLIDTSIKLFEHKDSFRIVGVKYYIDNNLEPKILLTKEGFTLATSMYFYENSQVDLLVTISNGTKTSQVPVKKIEISNNLPKDGFYILSDFYFKNKKAGYELEDIVISVSYMKMNYGRYGMSMDGKKYSVVKEIDKDKEALEFGETYSADALVLGADLYNEIIFELLENNYTQASLFFKNNAVAKSKLSNLKDEGYIAVLSNTVYQPEALDTILNTIGSFFGILGWFLGIIFIGLFINLCTRKSLEAFKTDIGIMRSMGITEDIIRVGTYVRVFICMIPAIIITIVGSRVLYHLPKTNELFKYLYFWQYLLIFIGMVILAYRVAHRQNKRIFKISVKKAIKEGENHD